MNTGDPVDESGSGDSGSGDSGASDRGDSPSGASETSDLVRGGSHRASSEADSAYDADDASSAYDADGVGSEADSAYNADSTYGVSSEADSAYDADDASSETDRANDADGGDHSPFLDEAMDEDEATVLGSETTAAVLATATGTEAGRSSHAAKGRFKRPPTWAISAAAAAVLGLVVGLLVGGGGDPAAPQAARPGTPPAIAEAGPVVTSLAHIAPVEVIIPKIEVDAPLVNLGLQSNGTLEVPTDYAKAGWFTGGNYPGDPSGPPGLIAGHVDNDLGPAVFYDLKELVVGDEVHVVRADNTVAVFVVVDAVQFPKNEYPAAAVYAPMPDSQLILVTCTGDFNENTRSYLDNLIVRATLDMERSLEESNLRVAEGLAAPAINQENV